MEVLNGSVFLPLFAISGRLGLKIYWFLARVGDMELGLDTGLGELNMEFSLELLFYGVASSLIVRFTFP